jgi:lipopolysaccharide transport system permease protein
MSAQYHAPKVDVAGLEVHAAFDIENTSGESWSNAEGFGVGYHIFDPETDTLVVDGARTRIEKDRVRLDMSFELPSQPGRYRVFVSPMRENVAWYYEQGWQFLLIDAVVAEGCATIERVRIATRNTIARERLRRTIGRIFTLPLAAIWRNRGLIRTMVRRDILGRYRGSFGGGLWTLLTPLLLMLTYFFVFGIVLETKFGNDPSRSGFVLYFFAGMLPWLAFSEAAGRAPTVMWEHRNFVKKLVFPVETLPVNLVVAGLVSECVMLALFIAGLAIARGGIPATVAWLPLILAPQVLFTLGMCWFLAALGVFVRDLGQVIGFLLTLWFFLTPICYPETQMPATAMPILSKNPIFSLVRMYRVIFLEAQGPAMHTLLKFWGLALVVFFAGYAWFYKLRRSFADIV